MLDSDDRQFWSVKETILELRKLYRNKIPIGESFHLYLHHNDVWQRYQLTGFQWRSKKKNGRKFNSKDYIWAFDCAICGAETTCQARWNFEGVNRTCLRHKGEYRGRRRPMRQAEIKARQTRLRDVIRETDLELAQVGRNVGLETFIKKAVARLEAPRAARDTRKQLIVRALKHPDLRNQLCFEQRGETLVYLKADISGLI